MPKYKFYTYDVWGNAKDGFEVNDIYPALRSPTGSIVYAEQVVIEIKDIDNTSDTAINRRLKGRGIQWDFQGEDTLVGTSKRNGRPIGELRLIEKED